MTLSFTAHWHDELPGFIPHSNQHHYIIPVLSGITIRWRTTGYPTGNVPAFRRRGRLGRETLLDGMQPLAQVYSGHQFGVWAGQLGTAVGSCSANNSSPAERRSTGT